jgi:hypothetical protein
MFMYGIRMLARMQEMFFWGDSVNYGMSGDMVNVESQP